jgi:hypothetical protein
MQQGINGTLDTSFMLGTSGAQWSECLINECLEKFIKRVAYLLYFFYDQINK